MFNVKVLSALLLAGATLSASPAFADDAKTYNVFVQNNFSSSSSDTQGRIAAGGNVTLSGYSVGSGLNSSSNGTNTLVVGGTLNFTNGSVAYGNILAGSVAKAPTVNHGTVTIGGVDLSSEYARMVTISNDLAGMASNGTTVAQYGGLTLTGTSNTLNIFTINASALSNSGYLNMTIPTASSALINVIGSSANWKGGLSIDGSPNLSYADNIIWNFTDATSLSMSNIGVIGTVLAPLADVTFNNGQLNGTLVAKSSSGSGEFHNYSYSGTLLDGHYNTGVIATPEPATWAMSILGFGLAGGVLRRRRRMAALAA